MIEPRRECVTELLERVGKGDAGAVEDLFGVVYQGLHDQAVRYMRDQPHGHTLQATALVHEVYVRLFGKDGGPWENRRHFLAVAARAMRSVLVDHARKKNRGKRRASGKRVSVEEVIVAAGDRTVPVLELDEALQRLASTDERAARVVECRFFGQYSMSEIAAILDVPKRSVERDWTFARLWLKRELGG